MMRAAGISLLALLAVHVAVRPEGGWLLLYSCDVAAATTAFGLAAGWHRAVAVAFVFELMIGLPSFAIAVLTTYDVNPTGVLIHLVPPALGVVIVARHGIPPRASLYAWTGYFATFVAGYALAPAHLNVNFASFVWPPLAGVFPTLLAFQAAILATALIMLAGGEWIMRRVFARGSAVRPATS